MNTQTDNDKNESEAPSDYRVVELSREPVELYKILKFESMVVSGGEAKAAVASGQVLVNGESETQKRKKIVSGDTIEFGEEKIVLKLAPAGSAETVEPRTKTEVEEQNTQKGEEKEKEKKSSRTSAKKVPSERKAISIRTKGSKK